MPFEQSDQCAIYLPEIVYGTNMWLKFAVLPCSITLSEMSNLCLSLPKYNVYQWYQHCGIYMKTCMPIATKPSFFMQSKVT